MKSLKIGLAATAMIAASATTATAAPGGHDYGEQPGYDTAMSKTACAGHGAFGVFGPGESMAGGADGEQTGLNNSGLCGNR